MNNGLPLGGSPPINSFYEEENGNIWYATQEGLVHFDPRKNAIGLIRSNAAAGEDWNNNVRNIAEDKDGNTWFATANGFCRLDKKTGAIKTWLPKFEADNYLNYPSVRSIGYSNGNIIVGQSEKGFWIFNPQNNTFRRPEYENDSIQRVFEDGFNSNMIQLRNGNFLIFSRRVWQMDKESYKVREVKFDGFKPVPRNAYEDALGRIWFAGSGGVFCTGDDFKLLYSLSNPEINRWANTIVQINENTFWIGAKHLFEIKLRPGGKMELKPLFTELKSIHFSHLYKDSLFRIWMYSDNGIYRYLPEEKVLEKFDRSDNAQAYNASISNSVRSRDGMLYAGSVNGINYFVPEKIPLQNDSLHVQLTNIIVNGDDSTFLLNRTLPMLKYLQNSLVFDFTAPYIYNGEKVQYRCRLQDTDKEWTYLGNENGIRYTSLKPGNYVFNIAASLNGKDWYENEKPFSFSIAPPFWQTWWFRLLLLFATILSIYKFIGWRGKQIAKREAHKTEVEKLKSINLQNQLEIEQVLNYFATSIGSQTNIDDMLWDVAKNCISKLGFEDCIIYLIDKERNVLIQKAAWGPKTNEQNKIIRPIEIDFGKGIVGAVAVSGKAEIIADTTLDERYIIDDASRLSEIAVPILEADKVIGVIDSEHSQKKFYTKQHLHILSTIAAMLSDSIEKIQAGQQAREKEIEVLQLNKDLSDWRVAALRAQMNPHFIFNSLNSISQLVASKQNEEGLQYLSKFSKLLRMVLDESEKSFISIKDEIKMLDLYLQLETLRFGNSFSYTIHADDTLDEEETLLPSFLIHPIIENAIWHGLLHKEGERRLIIRFIKKDKDKLICIVKDNGIGIEAATLKKRQQLNGEKQESKGLKMVKERLGLLEDQNHSSTSFKMEDMKDDNGYVSGTKCTLELPVIYE